MQKETPNNQPDWKQRLSELDELPADSPVNLSASWEKLHDKLGSNRKTNKRFIAWYAAAACAILAFLMVMIPDRPIESYTNTDIPAIKEPDSSSSLITIQTPQPPPLPADKAPLVLETKKPVHLKTPRLHKIEKQPAIVKQELHPVEAPIVIDVPDTPAAVQNNVAAAPVKKKLRVVHINELITTTATQEPIAKKSRIRSIHANNKNIARAYVNNTSSENVLKIRLTPSN
jgi:hypothetical protein